MELLPNPDPSRPDAGRLLIGIALVLLFVGTFFGVLAGWQYAIQGIFRDTLSFERVRPLHVSGVVFWILLGSGGAVLTYIPQHTGRPLRFPRLAIAQGVFMGGGIAGILIAYAMGRFGGREYWEFPPMLGLPVLAGWLCFLANVLGTLQTWRRQPVYVWMWATGAVFFLLTFLESYLWLIPFFRANVVADMTIQWKSYGSMVGAWNQLIYGASLFLMTRIGGDPKVARTPTAFALYFTGLFNLMFNWGHHIYTLPTHAYIQHISYIVSMTELILIGRIIWQWRASVARARRHLHWPAFRFLLAADGWVFLTLLLAVAMSVPAINLYTHGTHITVAHTMGATIGINTFLLLAIATDIAGGEAGQSRIYRAGFWMANAALLVFWGTLITAGVVRAGWQMEETATPFSTMMIHLQPVFAVFAVAGTILMLALWLVAGSVLRVLSRKHPHAGT